MRTTSVLIAALAASSVAAHDNQPRRMFYPRHVKRQFTNITITTDEAVTTPSETETTLPSSTKGQSLPDLVNGVIENLFPTTTAPTVSPTEITTPTNPTTGRNGTTESKDLPDEADPTLDPSTEPSTEPTADSTVSSTVVSVADPTVSASSSIVLFPTTAIVTSDPPVEPTVTPVPDPTSSKTDPLSSLMSEIEDILTSVLPPVNVTSTPELPTSTIVTIPDVTDTPTGTGPVTSDPPVVTSDPPVVTEEPTTTTPPPQETSTPPVITDPPPVTNTTEPTNPPDTPTITSTTSKVPDITTTPTDTPTATPPPITSATTNGTDPIPTTQVTSPSDGVTSIPRLGTVTNSQSWLPTTVLLDSTTASATGGLAPTTATGIPTDLPKAINPPSAAPQPVDTENIQIGLLEGYNYHYVVDETRAAAQVFNLLPQALAYAAGTDESKLKARDMAAIGRKITARKLQPLDTVSSLGYLTTVVIVSYPKHLIPSLRMDIKMPTSALYNNPDPLIYNFTRQINPAIDITIGAGADLPSGPGSPGDLPGAPGNKDPFANGSKGEKDSGQQAATAGIVTGAVAVAAAYGVAMFVIARRYKKKKQAHRRASSLTGSGRSSPSDMQETYRSSPAMGGALLSRDFTSNYGGVSHGGVSNGGVSNGASGRERDSHGSGRSGMNNSSRTQYISAPVAAENSLGWN